MWKAMLAGIAALAIAGSSLVYAQQQRPSSPDATPQGTARDNAPRRQISAEDAQAFAEARIAGLKAGLRLTPEQEKNWPPVESAMRGLAKQRIDRMAERRNRATQRRDEPRQRDAIEFLRRRATVMAESANGLKQLADAAEPLYKTLDDGQKRRLTMLASAMRSRPDGGRWHRRGFGGPEGRRGPAGDAPAERSR
jgi:hypothetical protein